MKTWPFLLFFTVLSLWAMGETGDLSQNPPNKTEDKSDKKPPFPFVKAATTGVQKLKPAKKSTSKDQILQKSGLKTNKPTKTNPKTPKPTKDKQAKTNQQTPKPTPTNQTTKATKTNKLTKQPKTNKPKHLKTRKNKLSN